MERYRERKIERLGPVQQKVLLLLLTGVGLSVARTPRQYFRVIEAVGMEWSKINDKALRRAIISLYRSKLVSEKINPDGSSTMILTDRGKKRALTFSIETMQIKKPKQWDKKWRLVLFDIPEKLKKGREALRTTLKDLGFYEYQKSVLVHPYECRDELDYVIEFFDLRPYVRLVVAASLDNELDIREKFRL